jgi:signal transduction histidine kinase
LNLRRILILFFSLCSLLSYGQTDVSVRLEWFRSFFSNEKGGADQYIDSLKHEIEKAITQADKASEAERRKELGLVLLTRVPNYDEAFSNFIRALEIEDSLNLDQEVIITYLAMSKVFEEVGEIHKSLEMLEYAADLSRPFKDINTLAYILNNQGRLNISLGDKETAEENYKLVLKNKVALESPEPEADAYFNLGQLYREKRDYARAIKYHKDALKIRREMKDQLNEAQSLNEIGEVYAEMKNPDKALANYVVALQIRTTVKDMEGLAQTYNNIGIHYYNQKNYQRAVSNFLLGLDNAKSTQSAEESAESYEYLSLCYKAAGDFQKSLEYSESSAQMIELMRSEKIEQDQSERQTRFVIEKKELKIRELQLAQMERELKIEAQRKTQNFLTVMIGFGIIIMLLVFYLYLVKRRSNISLEAAHAKVNQQNRELQNLNATKDKFFSIISHDLKGPLNSFTSFSRMLINHTDSLTTEEIQMLAKEIDKNLKNLFSLLENLLEWSRSQTGNIEFKPEVFDLNELITQNGDLLLTQAKNKNISLLYETSGSCIVNVHKHSVNTVIRNLISNAIKFTSEGGTVALSVRHVENEMRVSVRDTGVGMTNEVIQKLFRIDTKYSTQGTASEKGTGLGLILCKDFIEKNGGTIGVTSEPGKGSEFFFTLAAHNVSERKQVLDELNV